MRRAPPCAPPAWLLSVLCCCRALPDTLQSRSYHPPTAYTPQNQVRGLRASARHGGRGGPCPAPRPCACMRMPQYRGSGRGWMVPMAPRNPAGRASCRPSLRLPKPCLLCPRANVLDERGAGREAAGWLTRTPAKEDRVARVLAPCRPHLCKEQSCSRSCPPPPQSQAQATPCPAPCGESQTGCLASHAHACRCQAAPPAVAEASQCDGPAARSAFHQPSAHPLQPALQQGRLQVPARRLQLWRRVVSAARRTRRGCWWRGRGHLNSCPAPSLLALHHSPRQ